MAHGGLHDAGELLMGIMLTLVCVLLFVGCGAGAWWLRQRARVARSTPLTWFDVAAVPSHFFSSPAPHAFSPELLLDSLGAQSDQRRVHVSERPIPGLLGTELLRTIGVPTELAKSMRIAAAACGLMIAPSPAAVVGGSSSPGKSPSLISSPESSTRPISVFGPSAWLLGMDVSGEAVSVEAVPGSTILVLGHAALPPEHHWFREVKATSTSDLAQAWRKAWDPGVCRIVRAPEKAQSSDPVLAEIHCDIVVSVSGNNGNHAGEVVHLQSGFRQAFWPLFSSPMSSLPH